MGLSAFNAMRARMKAEQEALAKANAEKASVVPAEEIKPAEIETLVEPAQEEKVEDSDKEPEIKKTDAEKLKKKKEV